MRKLPISSTRYFDLVMVHGDPAFARLEETFPLADAIKDKVAYTGLVAAPRPPEATEQFDVLISAGGGAAGSRLVRSAVAAAKLSTGRSWCLDHRSEPAPARVRRGSVGSASGHVRRQVPGGLRPSDDRRWPFRLAGGLQYGMRHTASRLPFAACAVCSRWRNRTDAPGLAGFKHLALAGILREEDTEPRQPCRCDRVRRWPVLSLRDTCSIWTALTKRRSCCATSERSNGPDQHEAGVFLRRQRSSEQHVPQASHFRKGLE